MTTKIICGRTGCKYICVIDDCSGECKHLGEVELDEKGKCQTYEEGRY